MTTIYEQYGRLAEVENSLRDEYSRLLSLVSLMVSGEVQPSQVTVDTDAQSWTYDTELPTAAEEEENEPTAVGE